MCATISCATSQHSATRRNITSKPTAKHCANISGHVLLRVLRFTPKWGVSESTVGYAIIRSLFRSKTSHTDSFNCVRVARAAISPVLRATSSPHSLNTHSNPTLQLVFIHHLLSYYAHCALFHHCTLCFFMYILIFFFTRSNTPVLFFRSCMATPTSSVTTDKSKAPHVTTDKSKALDGPDPPLFQPLYGRV